MKLTYKGTVVLNSFAGRALSFAECVNEDTAELVARACSEYVPMKEEILSLHRQLAHEKLRADTGWQRYESSNRAYMAALSVIAEKNAIMQLAYDRLGTMGAKLDEKGA